MLWQPGKTWLGRNPAGKRRQTRGVRQGAEPPQVRCHHLGLITTYASGWKGLCVSIRVTSGGWEEGHLEAQATPPENLEPLAWVGARV